jgi:beta-hydroxylase
MTSASFDADSTNKNDQVFQSSIVDHEDDEDFETENQDQDNDNNNDLCTTVIVTGEDTPFWEKFFTSFTSSNFNKRDSSIIACVSMLILCVAYFVSILLAILLFIILFVVLIVRWFSNTDMSVEITVFLAKFFPPSKQNLWNTKTTPELAWSAVFRANYKIILGELVEFIDKYNYCPEMDDVYPNGSITNWDRKWPTVTLRCYGFDTQMCEYFPKTLKLVNDAPVWLSHVMFSILKPYKFIPRHRGPYRGVFRYQLALEIPPCKDPPNGLYLSVWPNTSSHVFWSPEDVPAGDPTIVTWTAGDDFIFDDTCVHEVHNSTRFRRIILFMDVERFDLSLFSKIVHKIFMSAARFLPTVQYAGKVQDKYLEECRDKQTNELQKWNGVVNENRILENNWMWYNTAPEILPFRKARVVIRHMEAKMKQEEKQKALNAAAKNHQS